MQKAERQIVTELDLPKPREVKTLEEFEKILEANGWFEVEKSVITPQQSSE